MRLNFAGGATACSICNKPVAKGTGTIKVGALSHKACWKKLGRLDFDTMFRKAAKSANIKI